MKQNQEELSSRSSLKNKALTLHLHTHHHIHNSSNSLSLSSSLNSKTVPLSIANDQLNQVDRIINVNEKDSEHESSTIENKILNLSTDNKTNLNQTIQRKSSPNKKRINSGTKSNK